MGFTFKAKVGDEKKYLCDLGTERSNVFVAITNLAAGHYQIPGARIQLVSDECWLDPVHFCRLVEEVFNRPIDLFYGWAYIAAGMYEGIKGQLYSWEWEPSEDPCHFDQTKEFKPVRYGHCMPTCHSGQTIRPYQRNR
jgi:hypothetical protein